MHAPQAGQRELTVEDLMESRHESRSKVSALVSGWFARQLVDHTVPRVRRTTQPGARWTYAIDAATYEAWILTRPNPQPVPPFATERARLLGCNCERFEHAGEIRAMVAASCPVHGALLATG